MGKSLDISQLLTLRKVTRGISELVTGQLVEHLSTLTPMIQPQEIFGKFVSGGPKQSGRNESEAFEKLAAIYKSLADAGKLSLPRQEIESPLSLHRVDIELTPYEYTYVASQGDERKKIEVTAPLKWVATYRGFSQNRLAELLAAGRTASPSELQKCVLHAIALHVGLDRRPGIVRLLKALRFEVTTIYEDEFGKLPITQIESSITTLLPEDQVVIESAEISGMSAFEEIVDLEGIQNLEDPLRAALIKIATERGAKLDA